MATDTAHLATVLRRAAQHKGAAFVQIWQNCPVFNDGAFDSWAERDVRDEALIKLEHGKPLLFGKAKDKALRTGAGFSLEVGGTDGAVVHDEMREDLALSMALAALEPPMPQPMGVLRAVSRPTVDALAREQEEEAARKQAPDLEGLLRSGDTWTVEAQA